MTTGAELDFEAVKQVQQKTWSAGDFAVVAKTIVIVSENLCEAADVTPGERVLDVACGSGNTAIAAARRAWGNTVGVDFVPELLENGKERAAAEGVDVEWVVGDAEKLPFDDASFDVVLSTFGAMFAPDQPRAAAELLRVCRPGGRIGMANWTPEGFVGHMFGTTVKHAPPPFKLTPPVMWGSEDHVRELFGDGVSELRAERRSIKMRFLSVDQNLEFFRTYFGPTKMAYERLDEAGREAYEADMRALLEQRNEAGDRALVVSAEYLEVVARRA
ncbi:class I SAM-dependent methyltransferase [Gaiella sp.]|jgi:ubiquinone/menaquinone biosynthesis C-methylase UbiE|uniref:class I SAM-dependent methyltransferase n=1 Tax=Gaiella sp. TaxID=2663207 RepID=UPI002E36ED8B|nr:methyltransferase domain-containing protein [Gaiella sp.]HEX5582729.1 methyltransferase domain-containing protein [Gaiella sp.]